MHPLSRVKKLKHFSQIWEHHRIEKLSCTWASRNLVLVSFFKAPHTKIVEKQLQLSLDISIYNMYIYIVTKYCIYTYTCKKDIRTIELYTYLLRNVCVQRPPSMIA